MIAQIPATSPTIIDISAVATTTTTTVPSIAAPHVHWWDTIKEGVGQAMDKVHLTLGDVTAMVVFFGSGLVFGLVLRRYGRFLFSTVLSLIIVMAICDHFGIIALHWDKIHALTGISSQCTLGQCWHQLMAFVRLHLLASVSALIGFVLGYSL